MIPGFLIVLVAAIAALYWIVLRNAAEKIATQYRSLSEAYGLELNEPAPAMGGLIRPEPSVYGVYAGRELSISVPGKGLQNTRQIETVLKLELKVKDFSAQIAPAGLLGGFRQRDSGGQARWKSGHAAFDAAVDVRSNSPDQLDRCIGSMQRDWLAATLKRSKGSIYIGEGVMAYAELGLIANEATRQRFENVVRFFQDFAETIESAAGKR
ncbi:MAG: hypothetical protein ACPGIC_02830 [Opitutales bacterium]